MLIEELVDIAYLLKEKGVGYVDVIFSSGHNFITAEKSYGYTALMSLFTEEAMLNQYRIRKGGESVLVHYNRNAENLSVKFIQGPLSIQLIFKRNLDNASA